MRTLIGIIHYTGITLFLPKIFWKCFWVWSRIYNRDYFKKRMGPLISLFWTSGDVSSRFQSQNGQPYSFVLFNIHYTEIRRNCSGNFVQSWSYSLIFHFKKRTLYISTVTEPFRPLIFLSIVDTQTRNLACITIVQKCQDICKENYHQTGVSRCHTKGESGEAIPCKQQNIQTRDPSWFWNTRSPKQRY